MKIIIAGIGEVGTHLAKMLSKENHEIVVMDDDEEKLRDLEANYDLMAAVGNPTSISALKNAGVADVDLFIAVTPTESQNITACILAKQLGAKKTLSRIDNYEYIMPERKDFFERLGISALIYPESIAAAEIAKALSMTWARQRMDFDCGLSLIGTKVTSNARILNQKLMELTHSEHYRIAAIHRNGSTIIPTGNDVILHNDIVYFITDEEHVALVRTHAGKQEVVVRNVMFMGGGRITVKTLQLLPEAINVKVMEKNKDRTLRLAEQINGATIIYGDASDLELMQAEGIADMDAFVALTGNSEANILACLAAKELGVRKTIAEVENIAYIPLAESANIGYVINKKLIAAGYIYRHTLAAEVSNVKQLGYANASVVELTAQERSRITKDKIKNIRLPRDMFIGGIARGGVGVIVKGDSRIEAGDRVIVFCLPAAMKNLEHLFD